MGSSVHQQIVEDPNTGVSLVPNNNIFIDNMDETDINDIPINLTHLKRNKKNSISLHPRKNMLDLHQAHPINNFFKWASNIGIRMKKLLVYEDKTTGKSSIKLGENIMKSDNIIEVPNQLIIYPYSKFINKLCNDLKKFSSSQQNLKEFKSNSDQICLAIYIADKQAKENSFINFLYENTDFKSFPFFFDQEESDMLKGSFFKSLVDVKRRSIMNEYKQLRNNNFIPEELSKKDYLRARVIVMSNSLKITDSITGQETIALIPVVGQLPNQGKRNAYLKMNKKNEIQLIADRKIEANENIVLDIGIFNNYQNLLYFGLTKKNKEKKPLDLSLNVDIPYNLDSSTNNEINLKADVNINKNLKIFRMIAYSTTKGNNKKRTYFSTPFDINNEILAVRLYKKSLKEMIGNYESTLQQDLDNYKTNENQNIINILRVLIEEKKILTKHFNANLLFLRILKKEYVNGLDLNSATTSNIGNLNVIQTPTINPINGVPIHHALQIEETKIQPVLLPQKYSRFILSKPNLKKYFDLIIKRFNLNYELNPGEDFLNKESLIIDDDEDINEFEELFVDDLGNVMANYHPIDSTPTGIVHPGLGYSQPGPLSQHVPVLESLPPSSQSVVNKPFFTLSHRIEPGLLENDIAEVNKINQIDNSGAFYNTQTHQNFYSQPQTTQRTFSNNYRYI
jgi:hypothetical protein